MAQKKEKEVGSAMILHIKVTFSSLCGFPTEKFHFLKTANIKYLKLHEKKLQKKTPSHISSLSSKRKTKFKTHEPLYIYAPLNIILALLYKKLRKI